MCVCVRLCHCLCRRLLSSHIRLLSGIWRVCTWFSSSTVDDYWYTKNKISYRTATAHSTLRLKYVRRDPQLKKPRYCGLFQKLRARIFRNKFYSSFLSIINPRRRLSVTVGFFSKCCCVRRRLKQQVSVRRPRPRLQLYRSLVSSCNPSDILGVVSVLCPVARVSARTLM